MTEEGRKVQVRYCMDGLILGSKNFGRIEWSVVLLCWGLCCVGV